MKNKISIPKDWNDIFIDQFVQLDSIDYEQFESVSAIQLERLSILTDTSSDDDIWDDMDIREMNKLVQNLKFLQTKPSNNVYKKICDDEFILINFNNLKFGEFIDLEYFIKQGENKNIDKISAILFRRYKTGEWGELIIEPYNLIDFNERSEFIKNNFKLIEVYGAMNAYKEWRETMLNTYKSLFQDEIEDDYNEAELSEIELEELRRAEEEEAKMAEFGWQRMLISLSEGDFLRMESYLEMGVIFLFNMLSVKVALKM
jgi:hypothetical protein